MSNLRHFIIGDESLRLPVCTSEDYVNFMLMDGECSESVGFEWPSKTFSSAFIQWGKISQFDG